MQSQIASIKLFPLYEYWWFYIVFLILVAVSLILDLGVFAKESKELSFKDALFRSSIWVSFALFFNYLFYIYISWKFAWDPVLNSIPDFDPQYFAKHSALEFLTGYVIELSLSVDNLFVFVVVFSYFGIPVKYQHRVLFYGIIGAVLFRGVFISMGALLIQYKALVILFGIFLVYTGIKVIFAPEKEIDPDKNPIVKFLTKRLPVTSTLHGEKFLVKASEGVDTNNKLSKNLGAVNSKYYATPLLITLVFIEISDVVFAIDSVPAIFAITKEPMIVFCSNILAILGLRSLYFLLAEVVEKFYLLKYGLGIVLIFVGLKMAWLNDEFDGHFPISWSLFVIIGVIGSSIVASLIFKKK